MLNADLTFEIAAIAQSFIFYLVTAQSLYAWRAGEGGMRHSPYAIPGSQCGRDHDPIPSGGIGGCSPSSPGCSTSPSRGSYSRAPSSAWSWPPRPGASSWASCSASCAPCSSRCFSARHPVPAGQRVHYGACHESLCLGLYHRARLSPFQDQGDPVPERAAAPVVEVRSFSRGSRSSGMCSSATTSSCTSPGSSCCPRSSFIGPLRNAPARTGLNEKTIFPSG